MAIDLGSLELLVFYMETSNLPLQQNKKYVPAKNEWKQAQRRIQKIWLTFENQFHAKDRATKRQIIPIIES